MPKPPRLRRRRASARGAVLLSAAASASAAAAVGAAAAAAAAASRAYPDGCSRRPPSYYDYDSYPFPPTHRPEWIRSTDDFLLLRRLGAGKFSDVFEAADARIERTVAREGRGEGGDGEGGGAAADPRSLVVIKCLKPVSERKVRRELLVLSHASELPNLARLRGVVVPDRPEGEGEAEGEADDGARRAAEAAHRMPSLVLEHAGARSRWLCHGPGLDAGRQSDGGGAGGKGGYHLSEYEIKYYLFHLLIALDALHSRGIMHRDVKPRNVLINRRFTAPSSSSDGLEEEEGGRDGDEGVGPLMLIDLGLADFYHPSTPYNVRVASRHYKSPELLVGYELYDYAIDLWGAGCILAGLLLRREPFFRGRDNTDQLGKIAAVLGSRDLFEYCRTYDVTLSSELRAAVAKYTARSNPGGGRRSWLSLLPRSCPIPSREGLDLLDRLLVYDHNVRYTAREAMDHPFFDEVREVVWGEVRARQRQGEDAMRGAQKPNGSSQQGEHGGNIEEEDDRAQERQWSLSGRLGEQGGIRRYFGKK